MKLRILLLFSCLPLGAWAQFSLSGKISLEGQADPAFGASVYIHELKTGTTADTAGYFRLTGIPKGTYTVRVSYV